MAIRGMQVRVLPSAAKPLMAATFDPNTDYVQLAMDEAAEDAASYIDLAALPEDDPIRERLLLDIKAEFKHITGYMWKPIEPDRPLARNTFNTLDGVWIDFFKWRARKDGV